MKWPKIGPNDFLALRDFADSLNGCAEAMPHVKGLAILNDSEENHKLLKKLPDWAVRKWSRIVVEELDASGEYPTFKCFAEFVQKEAHIACNPIKVQGSCLFVTYTIIQGIISSEMEVRTGPLNGQCKKNKNKR